MLYIKCFPLTYVQVLMLTSYLVKYFIVQQMH